MRLVQIGLLAVYQIAGYLRVVRYAVPLGPAARTTHRASVLSSLEKAFRSMSERDHVPVQGLINSSLQCLGSGVATHRQLLMLDMPPHPFDQVQVQTVRRQEENAMPAACSWGR